MQLCGPAGEPRARLPYGPVGLFPDPRALRNLRVNDTFEQALHQAWECTPDVQVDPVLTPFWR